MMTNQAQASVMDAVDEVPAENPRLCQGGCGSRDQPEAIVLAIVAAIGGAALGLFFAGQFQLLVWFVIATLAGSYAGWSARRIVAGP